MYWLGFTVFLLLLVVIVAYRELFRESDEIRKINEKIAESSCHDLFE